VARRMILSSFGGAPFIRNALLFLLISLWAAIVGVAQADENPNLRTTIGVVSLIDSDEDGHAWFEFDRIDERFLMDANVATAEAISHALKDSVETGRSVSVQYFIDGGVFPFGSTKPAFVVHQITYKGETIPVEASPPMPDPNAVPLPRDVAAENLAKGLAFAGDSDLREALPLLTAAIGSPALESPLRALALKTRESLYATHAATDWPPGEERDKLLLSALADARAWQSLASDDPHAASAIPSNLAALGDYASAIAQYRQIATRWPEEDFWPEIRIAGIERTLGDYDEALATLDDLAKGHASEIGMAYHYHRGWTFLKMGRFADAAVEFTEGFKSQPDYPGASFRRACAYAETGKLKEAIADYEQYIAGFEAYPTQSRNTPGQKYDEARAAQVLAELRQTAAVNPNAKLDAPCVGYWDWGDAKRERSQFLPELSSNPSIAPISP
jgi:tetratricopeptide (TPR) repeat protein